MSGNNTFLKRKPTEILQKAKKYLEDLSQSTVSSNAASTSETPAPDCRKSLQNQKATLFRLKSLDKYINDLSVSSEETRNKIDALLAPQTKKKELFKRVTDVRPEIPRSAFKSIQQFPTSTPLSYGAPRVDNLTISPIENRINPASLSDDAVVLLERNEVVENCVKALHEYKNTETVRNSKQNISNCRKELFLHIDAENSDTRSEYSICNSPVADPCEKHDSFINVAEQEKAKVSCFSSRQQTLQKSVKNKSESVRE